MNNQRYIYTYLEYISMGLFFLLLNNIIIAHLLHNIEKKYTDDFISFCLFNDDLKSEIVNKDSLKVADKTLGYIKNAFCVDICIANSYRTIIYHVVDRHVWEKHVAIITCFR